MFMKKRGNDFVDNFKFTKSKRAQVTIFIILGIIIVAVGALIYFLYPQIKSTFIKSNDPQTFIQTCVQDAITQTISNLSMQGGSISPQNFYSYYSPDLKNTYKVEYLCYTNHYYLNCEVQQPLLLSHVESEIIKNIQPTVDSCFNSLQSNYKNQGYSVNFVGGNTTVNILPGRVVVTFNDQLTLTRQNSERFDKFNVLVNNNLYELIMTAYNIVNSESNYGDANERLFMFYYHNLVIQKDEQSDGTKVYVLKDMNTGDIFQFAVRGGVWPAGYGIEGVQ